ncbi:MAG: HAD hydrolase-like protein [Methylobacterium sp.]|uniref:HAD hydrolase-like protein n=1 Tax=Methylobacterium sp. TaxID=409 RepID=UPI0025EF3A26|nr:HAD hydrolase-like protein [Methylobacterium sp.]MBX9932022.1 HAD hydrolase-like protein [Methylobacterium sp.]
MVQSEAGGSALLSCDVFDTLLHRDRRAQTSRFEVVAKRAGRRLREELGVVVETRAILQARLSVHTLAYRVLDIVNPRGEVRFADLVDGVAAILGLHAHGATIIAEAEIAVEHEQLVPNRRLLTWLSAEAQAGSRVIAISDTWHSARTISGLLDALAPGHPVAAIYTSADWDATKRSGSLFQTVLDVEGIAPDRVLHIGDDPVADLIMARGAGLRCRQVERPAYLRLGRKVDALRFRLRHPAVLH